MSAAEGQHIARLMLTTLSKIRSDSSYSLFWNNAKLDAVKLEIGDDDYLTSKSLQETMKWEVVKVIKHLCL